jgi:aminopeptidase
MSPITRALVACTAVVTLAACGADDNPAHTGSALGTAPRFDFDGIAHDIVNRNAAVAEGERVLITGSPADIELLENLAVHVRRAGAHPLITLTSERLERRMFDDVPAVHDTLRYEWSWATSEIADVIITVPFIPPEGFLDHVPVSRLAAQRDANVGLSAVAARRGIRVVEIGNGLYPATHRAERFGITTTEMARLFWEGVQADPGRLAATADALKRTLAGGRTVHITHPNGTDISFRIDGRPAFVNDGVAPPADAGVVRQTLLPAGEVYVAPVPGTANGRIVAERYHHLGREIGDVTFTVADGRLVAMESPGDLSALRDWYDVAPAGRDVLGVLDIGINPGITSQRMLAWVTAGMVTLAFGQNAWAGGEVDINWLMPAHLPGTTVRVDDRVIVENGVLML